jgi:hypothetical protein
VLRTDDERTVDGRLDIVRNARTAWYEMPEVVLAGPHDTLLVEGWCSAADPAAELTVTVDGAARGRLVRGTARPDLVPLYGAAGERAGFRGALPLAGVAPGEHALEVVAAAGGATFRLGGIALLVAPPEPPGPLSHHVMLDVPPSGELAYPFGALVRPSGWAADAARGAAVRAAALVLDDRWVVQARAGLPRPDVAALLGCAETALGFEGVLAGELLGPGPHTARALAFTADGSRLDATASVRIVVVDEL